MVHYLILYLFGPKLVVGPSFWRESCSLGFGLVGVRFRVNIGDMVSLGGLFRVRDRFWLGPGTRLDPLVLGPQIMYHKKVVS